MKKFVELLTKENEKTAMNEWVNDDSDILQAFNSVYIKKLGQFFSHTYSSTCLNKDTSLLSKVINLWTSS